MALIREADPGPALRLAVQRAALGALLLWLAALAFAQSTPSRPAAFEVLPRHSGPDSAFRVSPGDVRASHLRLADIEPAAISKVRLENSRAGTKRLQIGIGRRVTEAVEAESKSLAWRSIGRALAAHWKVTSKDARAVRIGLRVDRASPGIEVRFAGSAAPGVSYGPFSAADLFTMGAIFWSPVLEGDTALMEVFVPEGGRTSDVELAIVQVSHLLASPADPQLESALKAADACEVNLICRSASDAALANTGKAVARMTFSDGLGGSTYLCTGTLLSSTDGLGTPYFYSANHCIGTQASASTLTTHWFYDSTACSTNSLSSGYRQLTGGATLLFSAANSDVLLLRLNNTPPSGAWFAGWDAASLSASTPVVGVHHPKGDLKKVSLGATLGFSQPSGYLADGFVLMSWSSGVTEGGSSGSGLFTAVGNPATDYRLRGGLWGGASYCSAPTAPDYYSRLDLAFSSLAPYLNPTPSPGTLQFTTSAQSVSESAGSVVLQVTRALGTIGAVAVSYSTANGSATSGADYGATSGTLSWAAGDASTRTITVPILADTESEALESFAISLTAPTGGATLGTTSTATVSIFDPSVTRPSVSAGSIETCATDVGGNVSCWGWSLPLGASSDVLTPTPVTGFASRVSAIAAGYAHTCVLTVVGSVQCMGLNFDGQLGNGGASASTVVDVLGLASGVRAIATGEDHTCALTLGGAVQCWGRNDFGQLGVNATTNSNVPVLSFFTSGVSAIAAGIDHTCALLGGGVQCWGRNQKGQLGNGTLANSLAAVQVTGLASGVAAVAAGGDKTCALLVDGTVKCWGDGTMVPAAVSGLSGVSAIEVGGMLSYSHACAVVSDGTVKCWGDNAFGQLGNGTTIDSPTPVSPIGLPGGAIGVSAGGWHSCALLGDGSARCWGFNDNGQLGNGTNTNSSTPVQASGVNALLAATTTTLTATPTVLVTGQNVDMTATVSGISLTGSVAFRDGANAIAGCSAVPLASGQATCSAAGWTLGTHSVTATYLGDGTNASSTSAAALLQVKEATTVTLASSPNPSAVGQSVTITATVTGTSLTGSVLFKDAASTLSGCSAVPVIAGSATCATASLALGTHGLTGTYSGDAINATAVSPIRAHAVRAAQSIALSASSLDFGGQSMNTTSVALALTLTNDGSASATIDSVSAAGDFAASHQCATLAVGATCRLQVTFTPRSEGTRSGTLTIASTAGTKSVSLTGTGERSLVTHYYRSILGRDPDAGGKGFWTAESARMAALGANVNETWFAMAQSFFNSAEYVALGRSAAGYVRDLYATFFNRAADDAGLAYWTGLIDSGMPREVVLTSFMFSGEFTGFAQAIFGNTAARAEVDTVVDFYRGLLGRLPDDGGFGYWVGKFRTAQCQGAEAVYAQVEAISSAYAGSAEYAGRARSNAQFVGDMYNAFLRRGGDLEGVKYWISQLDTTARSRDELRRAFIASPEFSARVSAVVGQGCLP